MQDSKTIVDEIKTTTIVDEIPSDEMIRLVALAYRYDRLSLVVDLCQKQYERDMHHELTQTKKELKKSILKHESYLRCHSQSLQLKFLISDAKEKLKEELPAAGLDPFSKKERAECEQVKTEMAKLVSKLKPQTKKWPDLVVPVAMAEARLVAFD